MNEAATPGGRVSYRRAISIHFLIDGIGFGVWAALLPTLQSRLAIDDGELSLILLLLVVGAVLAMSLVGRIINHVGSDVVLRWVTPLFCVTLCLPILASNYVLVAISAVLFGAFKGSLDVCVNSNVLAVQRTLGRIIFSSAQALWSIGGVAAATLVGLAIKAGLSPTYTAVGIATVLLLMGQWYSRMLLPELSARPPADQNGAQPVRSAANRRLWWIGVVAFCALFAEGVMMDWSAIYSHRVGGADEWLAPFAYGVFCTAMGTGRLLGDRIITRIGYDAMLRASALVAGVGLLLTVLLPFWEAIFCGLLAVGLGLSNMVPIFLSAAERAQPRGVAQAVAMVSMIGYTGFLAGPPVVGFISAWVGLQGAFVLVLLLVIAMGIWGAMLLKNRSTRHVGSHEPQTENCI